MKASVTFYPNVAKRNARNGKYPIYMRVTFKRSKTENRINAEVSELDLLKWDPMTMRLKERNNPLNHHLNRLERQCQDFVLTNATQLSRFSSIDIRNFILGLHKTQDKRILQFADDYFEVSILNNPNNTPGTIKNYRRGINHLTSFLKYRHLENLSLAQLNYELASSFMSYLVNTDPVSDRQGKTDVSAAGVIKKMRTIFNHAVETDQLKRNPFKQIKIKTKSPRKERLTIDQVKKLKSLNLAS